MTDITKGEIEQFKKEEINIYNLVSYINQEMNDSIAMSLFYSNKKLTKEEEEKMAKAFIEEK